MKFQAACLLNGEKERKKKPCDCSVNKIGSWPSALENLGHRMFSTQDLSYDSLPRLLYLILLLHLLGWTFAIHRLVVRKSTTLRMCEFEVTVHFCGFRVNAAKAEGDSRSTAGQ